MDFTALQAVNATVGSMQSMHATNSGVYCLQRCKIHGRMGAPLHATTGNMLHIFYAAAYSFLALAVDRHSVRSAADHGSGK